MNSRAFLLCGVLFIALGQIVHAREWKVVPPETPDSNVSMQVAGHACPEHFDPVSLSAELRGFQKNPIEDKRPGNFVPAGSSRVRPEGAPDLDTHVAVTACLYRSYFLPIQASVTFLGDWGEERKEALEIQLSAESQEDGLRLEYNTYLLSGSRALDGLRDVDKEAIEANVAGFLVFRFGYDPVRLTGENHDGDLVHLKSANFSFFVPIFTD
ncbi:MULTISPECIES: hypothetical protein [unclassified Ruegeria]|uniref:hypothetical protein n=1 Tax=unclassified Ruegeria TaxID=2625375 RepID=UPI001ADAD956|nr:MULTISPECIES: hypothetical protein [unclassified Ruegeria]MBO9410491.1 hypothetical protein [Ruegeria sp. R8_1]MBO9414290.1 hypothetical protein [Ruegeria sp. R8_2]